MLPTFVMCPRCGTNAGPPGGAPPQIVPAKNPRQAVTGSKLQRARVSVFSGTWSGTGPAPAATWRRAIAVAIDIALLTAGSAALAPFVPALGPILLCWLYFAWCESSGMQATLGKRLLGLKVTDVNGVRLQFGRATLRFFCRFLSALPLFLGYFFALLNPARQALHDLLASTRVVAR